MYENGHYFLLTMILQAPTMLSVHAGSRFFAHQLARSLTERPATFLTIVSLQRSVRDSTSFSPALLKTHSVSLLLKLYFQEEKKNQHKNSSGPKYSLRHLMLRGTQKIWPRHFLKKSTIGRKASPFRFCAYFYNCLALPLSTLKNQN